MTKLEEEIYNVIYGQYDENRAYKADKVREVSEVAKKYIEIYKQSFENKIIKHQKKFLEEKNGEYYVVEGYMTHFSEWDDMWELLIDHHEEWLRENGII